MSLRDCLRERNEHRAIIEMRYPFSNRGRDRMSPFGVARLDTQARFNIIHIAFFSTLPRVSQSPVCPARLMDALGVHITLRRCQARSRPGSSAARPRRPPREARPGCSPDPGERCAPTKPHCAARYRPGAANASPACSPSEPPGASPLPPRIEKGSHPPPGPRPTPGSHFPYEHPPFLQSSVV